MTLIEYLKNDEELKSMRKRWKELFVKPFPPFNTDEYKGGVDGYKKTIKNIIVEEETKNK